MGEPPAQLDAAIRLATRAHAGQTDLRGEPYIGHPLRVMELVPGLDAKLVAVLHDVLEDTAVTAGELAEQGVPGRVIEAVQLVSRSDGESYERFIERIAASGNQLAILVKLADLHDNTDPARALPERPELEARYAAARRRLRPELDGAAPAWLDARR